MIMFVSHKERKVRIEVRHAAHGVWGMTPAPTPFVFFAFSASFAANKTAAKT